MQNEIKVADYATDPNIEAHTKSFLNSLNSGDGKPMEQMTPGEARRVLEGAQTSVTVNVSGIDVTEKTISQDGLSVKMYVIKPAGKTSVLPVFMFFHGGGWVLGDFLTHKRFVRDLVVYSGVACVFVEYTRSPEAKYPAALNECYAATKWVAEHGAEINVDGKKLAVVGNSVGGNLTAATALMAKQKGGPALKLQLLFWPVTNADFETGSYNQYATQRFLTKNMMIWFWDNYTGEQRNDILASPLKASLDQLKGLPPAYVQTAENDVLRDEGEAYARKMDEAGVDVTLTRVQGMIHDFGLLNPLATTPAVQAALRSAGAEIANALK
ncbi:alpha/beta hydrolase [Pinibacter soli]|uniref:Alpha/beta hydrolase n=1 Tax=Pinibacter soli TaxID=3044211 RepID=A0ABT6RCR2_9BACT|nr:alpha/beta hydrolase [Pinibacter soli]MDI3320362.1 alpha/beta hydrolase [Pinibacter soli]